MAGRSSYQPDPGAQWVDCLARRRMIRVVLHSFPSPMQEITDIHDDIGL